MTMSRATSAEAGSRPASHDPRDWLRAEGLTKSYGAGPVLEGVDLSVAHGEIVALLGPSGSGKTTLLSLVAGFTQPDRGEIVIGGRNTAGLSPRERKIGVMFQNYALFPHMTVKKNILFGLQAHRIPRPEQEERVRSVLDLTKLGEFASRMPSQLSGGQQQRVALARALVIQPDLLLLDEPFSGLDAQVRERMRIELTRELRDIGATALLVTHDQADASAMADRVAVIDKGCIAQIGTYDDLYTRPASRFVASFVGESNWFTGKVVESGESLAVRVGASEVWRTSSSDLLEAGDAVDVMARRNAVTNVRSDTRPASPGTNALAGRLLRTIPSGPTVRLWLDVTGVPMVFDVAPHLVPAGLAESDSVIVEIDPGWTRAYRAVTEDKISDGGA